MPNFIPYNHNQDAMVVINYLDQLQPGTFEHAIHYLVENKLDLSIYFPAYNNEDNGRPLCPGHSLKNYFIRLFKRHYLKL